MNPSSAVAGQRPAPRAPRAGRTRKRGPAQPAPVAVEPAREAGPLTRWWLARLPASDTWTLGQRNVYILPSRSGMAFAGLLLVMLLASINYQLNLGYVLTFLVAGAAGVSMHMTHATLRGLTLRVRPPAPGFAGDPARIEIVVTSPGRARHAVVVRLHDRAGGVDGAAAIDVPAQGQASATLALLPARRGWHAVPPGR